MEKEIDITLSIVSMIVITFNLFILMTIIMIHTKRSYYRINFFKVILIQIIIEFSLNLMILVVVILSLIDCLLSFLPMIINFLYNCDILYNLQTIFLLINSGSKNDTEDIYDNDDISKTDEVGNSKKSINLKQHNFIKIHIFSLFFSLILTVIYHLIFIKGQEELNQYFYFLFIDKDSKDYLYLIIFLFNYGFFILSVKYCFVRPSLEITKLTYYSIYAFISSFISLSFPLIIILNNTGINRDGLIQAIYAILFLLYLISTTLFRLFCFYVQSIFSRTEENKIIFGLKILFTRQKIPSPHFIDFNNSFLIHSLSYERDIFVEKDKHKQEEEIDNDNNDTSRSYSLAEN
jgi:hypothetical protein